MNSTKRNPVAIYWFTTGIILAGWIFAMFRLGWWDMFSDTWPFSVTMVLGSFVAGATAEGGGAVAFPVFTKAFDIAPRDARVFAFMIQSFGMTMAGLFIYLKRIPVLWNVVGLALAAGVAGLITGELFLLIPDPFPKLFFSFVAAVFGVFLIYNRWVMGYQPVTEVRLSSVKRISVVLITGFTGGLVSSVIGVGVDMVLFIVLTLMFGVNEKISTPTTVVLMGLLSVVGFVWHGSVSGFITEELWRMWMSCVPIVIFGAPLGAWVCSKIQRDHLIYLLLLLIAMDAASTLLLIPITTERLIILGVLVVFISLIFYVMIKARERYNGYM